MIMGVQTAVPTASSGRVAVAPRVIGATRGIRVSREAGWVWLAVAINLAVCLWWLAVNNRIPIWDAGFHLTNAYVDGIALSHGHIAFVFERWTLYAPLVHLLGGMTYVLVGLHPMAMTFASDLVFVPLLAFGCYGVGSIVSGRRAGVLAGLFALGAPMFVSMSHEFMMDPPQAAMISVSVWAILASRRFARPGVSVTAGVLCGLAMLTKETSVLFLAGIVAAAFVRGGWRNWRGLILFAVSGAVIAGPWYVYQWHNLTAEYTSIGQLYVSSLQSPPRFSLGSFGWYLWDLVNQQLSLVMALAFLGGVVVAVVRCVRTRFTADSVLPELLAGAGFSYLAITYLTHKDPRYSLPGLVYMAVLGTFWLPSIRRRAWRTAALAAVMGFAAVNFVGMSTGLGGTHRLAVSLPSARNDSLIYTRQLAIYQNQGWLYGGPEQDGDVPALLKGLRAMGINQLSADGYTANAPDFNQTGIAPYASEDGIATFAIANPTNDSVFLILHAPKPGEPRPCGRLRWGAGIYAIRGPRPGFDPVTMRDPGNPRQQYQFVCPGRAPVKWPAVSG